jgi:ABC-2 family transporter
MRPAFIIAGKELRDGMRNRWVLATTALMAALALTLAFLGTAPTGTVKASGLVVTIVSLSSLTIFLVPLIALLLSYDAIVGEADRGTSCCSPIPWRAGKWCSESSPAISPSSASPSWLATEWRRSPCNGLGTTTAPPGQPSASLSPRRFFSGLSS